MHARQKFLFISLVSLLLFFLTDVQARQGCCSHHGGVCGNTCCDGSPLSAKCGGGGNYYQPQTPQRPPAPTLPSSFTGKVTRIIDGDTIEVIYQKKPAKIRLNGIDAPEKKQPFGAKAKEFTTAMVGNQVVTIAIYGSDSYGRMIGEVTTPDGASLNQELVKNGLAWHYSDNPALADLETKAKEAKIGLWADANPIPPWEYRKQNKEAK